MAAWVVTNALGVIGFGWVHQGGVMAAAAAAGRRILHELAARTGASLHDASSVHDADAAVAREGDGPLRAAEDGDQSGSFEDPLAGISVGIGGAAASALLTQMAGSSIGTVLNYGSYTLPRSVIARGWSKQWAATGSRCPGVGGLVGSKYGELDVPTRKQEHAGRTSGGASELELDAAEAADRVAVQAASPRVYRQLALACREDGEDECVQGAVTVPRCAGPFCDSRLDAGTGAGGG